MDETKFENVVVMNELHGGNVIIKTDEDVILNRVLYNTYFQSGKRLAERNNYVFMWQQNK